MRSERRRYVKEGRPVATAKVSDARIDQALERLGPRLRSLRLDRQMVLNDLANLTGFSPAYLSRIEDGKRSPALPALLRLAHALGVSVGTLLEPAEESADAAHHLAGATWVGTELDGTGSMWAPGIEPRRFDLASRGDGGTEREEYTSPEEHLGMALAGCFSMSLSQQLGAAGYEAGPVSTEARVHSTHTTAGVTIEAIALVTRAEVAGIEFSRLDGIAHQTKKTCVVARALAAVPITLEITNTAT
jgi:OsmC subfamily peroxiredoxin